MKNVEFITKNSGQTKLKHLSKRGGPKDLATQTLLPLASLKTVTLVHFNPTARKRTTLLRARVDTDSGQFAMEES